jgi:RNA-binding protein PNO1
MIKLIIDKLSRITKNQDRLEKILKVKITNRGKEVFIEGLPENEYDAEKVIQALNFGFPFATALLIKEEEFLFEILNIKEHTKRKDLQAIRARIIGANGKTLKTLTELTKCNFEIKDNGVGIIGDVEDIENAQQAIISLIKGSKTANVYAYLEKHHPQPILDLGLKEIKKKK